METRVIYSAQNIFNWIFQPTQTGPSGDGAYALPRANHQGAAELGGKLARPASTLSQFL